MDVRGDAHRAPFDLPNGRFIVETKWALADASNPTEMDAVEIFILDGGRAWRERLSLGDIKTPGIGVAEYVRNLKQALVRQDRNGSLFEYEFSFEASDVWSPLFVSCRMKLVGAGREGRALLLDRVRIAAAVCIKTDVMDFVGNLLTDVHAISSQLEQSREAHAAAMARLAESTKTLDDAVARVCDVESALYAKFVAVLNEKKRRIRELEASGASVRPPSSTNGLTNASVEDADADGGPAKRRRTTKANGTSARGGVAARGKKDVSNVRGGVPEDAIGTRDEHMTDVSDAPSESPHADPAALSSFHSTDSGLGLTAQSIHTQSLGDGAVPKSVVASTAARQSASARGGASSGGGGKAGIAPKGKGKGREPTMDEMLMELNG